MSAYTSDPQKPQGTLHDGLFFPGIFEGSSTVPSVLDPLSLVFVVLISFLVLSSLSVL